MKKIRKEEGGSEVDPENVVVGSDTAVDQVHHVEEELKLVKEELDAKCDEVCQLKGELSKNVFLLTTSNLLAR